MIFIQGGGGRGWGNFPISKRTPKKTTHIWVKELCNNSFKFNQMTLCRILHTQRKGFSLLP